MFKEIKNLLYPAILVTHIDLFKVVILSDPPASEHQLDILLGKPQPQPIACWQLAKNLAWTFNAYGVKAMLKEKPIDALKLLNKAIKILEIKQTGIDWTDRDEYKVLKIAVLRNLVYFYYKHDDYRLATRILRQIDKLQQSIDPTVQDSIDLATPYLLMLYNYFMDGKIEESLQISKVLTFLCKEYLIDCAPGVDYLEPTLNPKRNEIHRMVNYFIQAKCYHYKEDYKTSVEKFKPGVKLLQAVIYYFGEEYKDLVLKEFMETKQKHYQVQKALAESERRRQYEKEKIDAANREKLQVEVKLEYQKLEKLRPMTAQTNIRPLDIEPTQPVPVPERLSDAHDPDQMKLALKQILRKSKTGSLAVSESNATLAELDQLKLDSVNPSIAVPGSRELFDIKKQASIKRFPELKGPLMAVDSLFVPSIDNIGGPLTNKASHATLIRVPSRPTTAIKEKDKEKEKSSNDKSKSSKKSAFAQEDSSSKNSSIHMEKEKPASPNIAFLNTPSRLRKSKSVIKSQVSTMQELEFFRMPPSIASINQPQTDKAAAKTANILADPRMTDPSPTPSPELPSTQPNFRLRIPTIETNNFMGLMNTRPGGNNQGSLPTLMANRINSVQSQKHSTQPIENIQLPKPSSNHARSSSNRSLEQYNSMLFKAIDGVETIQSRSDTNELREMLELIDMPSRRPSLVTTGSSSSDLTQPQAISVSSISSHKSQVIPGSPTNSPGLRSPASRTSFPRSPKGKSKTSFLQLMNPKVFERLSPRSPTKLTSPHELLTPQLNDGSNTNKNLLLPISQLKGPTPSSRLSTHQNNAISFAQMVSPSGGKTPTPSHHSHFSSDKSSTEQLHIGDLAYLRQIEDRAANLIKVQILLYNVRKRRFLSSSPPTTIMGQTPTPTPTPTHTTAKDGVEGMTPHIPIENVGTPKAGGLGTPKIGTPMVGTPKVGTPRVGESMIGSPKVGTPRVWEIKSASELQGSQIDLSMAPASTIQMIKEHVSKEDPHDGRTPTSLNDSVISNSVPTSIPVLDDTPGLMGGKTPKGGMETPKSWQRKGSNSPGFARLSSNTSAFNPAAEKEPIYKIEQKPKELDGLMIQTLKFVKMFFLQVHHWKLKTYFKSGLKTIEFLILELKSSQNVWIHFELPFKYEGNLADDDKDYNTNWPIVAPNFITWFEKEGMGPHFMKYQTTYLQDYSQRVIRYRDWKSPKKGHKHKEEKELTQKDFEAMLEIHKRLLYMIDKRLIVINKVTGKYLARITSDEMEDLKLNTIRDKLFKNDEFNLKRIQWNPDVKLPGSEKEYILRRYGDDRDFPSQQADAEFSYRSGGIIFFSLIYP